MYRYQLYINKLFSVFKINDTNQLLNIFRTIDKKIEIILKCFTKLCENHNV